MFPPAQRPDAFSQTIGLNFDSRKSEIDTRYRVWWLHEDLLDFLSELSERPHRKRALVAHLGGDRSVG